MAKTRQKNPRTAMRTIKPGGEVAEGTGILGPSRQH
jgi:hypothetical protein